jgi:predicted transcriptional regulator
VLRVVDERPGVTVAELAASSGVKRTTLYGILRLLIERGEVAKRELPGGQAGYARAEPARPPNPEASPTRPS